jgi:hypothetical protein
LSNDDFDPNNVKDKLKLIKNAADQAHFSVNRPEEIKVQVRPDSKVRPAVFLPDPLIPGGFKAHPVTIRAMRKEIFAAGSELFEDLEQIYQCESCKESLDVQFWHFCPYCEAPFREIPSK